MMVNTALVCCLLASGVGGATVFDYSFNAPPLNSNIFRWEYSYDKKPANGVNPSYFDIALAPDNSYALRVNIYSPDKPLSSDSTTCPRAELSGNLGTSTSVISDNIPYVAQWYSYISKYESGYDMSLVQVFGTGKANIMLKFTHGEYSIWSTYTNPIGVQMSGDGTAYGLPVVSEDLHEDMHRWVTWRMEFQLSATGGYVRVYKDGTLIGNLQGNTAGGGQSYWKQGIYTQFYGTDADTGQILCDTRNATIYIKNFQLVSGNVLTPLTPLSYGPTNPPTTTTTTASTTTTTASTRAPNTGSKGTTVPTTRTTKVGTTTVWRDLQIPTMHASPATKPYSAVLVVVYATSFLLVILSIFGPNAMQ